MANDVESAAAYALLETMRDARDAPSVMKSRLAALRAVDPDVCVIAFEGIDDKTVYYHWIKQIVPDFVYEPFVCKGKSKVLQLKKMLEQDLGQLSNGVVYIIDRDFDDLCGHQSSEKLFMTQTYSFENYLVNEVVLDELLKNELHCHAEPACREGVRQLFHRQYFDFLNVTKDINFRIFVAKRYQIPREKELPKSLNRIATVGISSVTPAQEPVCAQVGLTREPTEEECTAQEVEFAKLNPMERYRGKFALIFFSHWLGLLAKDRNDAVSTLFSGLDREGLVARQQFTLDSLAARAPHPIGLRDFLLRIA
jgi:hypothetical protein